MRVLVFTNCPLDPTLGSGKTVLRWSEALRAHGDEVKILTPKDFELDFGVRKGWRWRLALGAWWCSMAANLAGSRNACAATATGHCWWRI
jgi:hypothetical protein